MTSRYDSMTFVVLRIIFHQTKQLAGSELSKCLSLVSHLPQICRASVYPIMGNCLKSSGQDDISLLHDEESADSPTTGEPPPPYQVEKRFHILPRLITLASIPRHSWRFFSFQEEAPIFIQSQHAPHLLSEEQQIRLAQRLGLIQHLPVGKYDGSKGKKREYVKSLLFSNNSHEERIHPWVCKYYIKRMQIIGKNIIQVSNQL